MQIRLMARLGSYALVLLFCACTTKDDAPADDSMPGPGVVTAAPETAGAGGGVAAPPANVGSGGSTTGSAGITGSMGTGGIMGTGGSGDMMGVMEPMYQDPRGKCSINSGFPDDNACLLAPDPSVGFQVHIGPTDYNNPDEINKFLFEPGMESSECWTFPHAERC